jgi:hypothetical protein
MEKTASPAFSARFLRWQRKPFLPGRKLFHDLILDNAADF